MEDYDAIAALLANEFVALLHEIARMLRDRPSFPMRPLKVAGA